MTTTDPYQPATDAVRQPSTLVEMVPVLQEVVRVEKRVVETDRVRLHKTVHETDELVELVLQQEELQVERVPIGRVVSEPPTPRQEGDTFIIPVLEEQIVVEKRLVLKEELRIQRKRTEQTVRESIRLRSEEVRVEQIHPDQAIERS